MRTCVRCRGCLLVIEIATGNMLESPAEALVCTVNTKGAMGKGIALAFAKRFDGLLDHYGAACERGELRTGSMWNFPTGLMIGPRLIICFPTKQHWARPSQLQWIEDGLQDLANTLSDESVSSVAVPALGCGHGGLAWPHVEPLIHDALGHLDTKVLLYPPR